MKLRTWKARRALARGVRATALATWRLAERVYPAEPYDPDEWQDDDGAYGDQWEDNASHDSAHPHWIEGCHGCQARAARKEEERAESRARHPSRTGLPPTVADPGHGDWRGPEDHARRRGARPDLVIVDDPVADPPARMPCTLRPVFGPLTPNGEPHIHITTEPCALTGCDLSGFHFHWRGQVYLSAFDGSMSPEEAAAFDVACRAQHARIAAQHRDQGRGRF